MLIARLNYPLLLHGFNMALQRWRCWICR